MRSFAFLLLLTPSAIPADLAPAEIIRRAAEHEEQNVELRRQYTYRESISERLANKEGKVRRTDQLVHDVFFIGGEEFRLLVEKDGRPLSEKEAAKERARMDRQIEKFKRESPERASKRVEKERREEKEFLEQFVNGFNFKILGEELVAGKSCYRVHAEPKPGFPLKGEAKVLAKVKGDLWIDKEQQHWTKVEAETIDTITAMAGLLRLAKGTTFSVTRTHVNNEVWFPDRVEVHANARAALFLTAAVDVEMLFSAFKKYSVDSKVTIAQQ